MKALVLEKTERLSLRDISMDETLGPRDVRVKLHSVGICGSDVHYYQHGRIGPFVVEAPMVLGHEASGTVIEAGSQVTRLKVGDRVCMEPGIPDPSSRPSRLGMYNLDPAVRFWATPPIHGILRPTVVHPADFTFKVPDNVSFAQAAMVEPLAVGMHAAMKAKIKPGDVAVVTGAGPIGVVTALAALAGGCSRVIISDVQQPKLDLAASLGPITPVNAKEQNLQRKRTSRWRSIRGPLPWRCGRAGRHADATDRVRCGRRPDQGSPRRTRLPLRPRLPARARPHGQRKDRCEAPDHRPFPV
jgi:D-xylulose reductase